MKMQFAAVHESVRGTKRTNRAGLEMSVDGGKIGSGWPTVKPTRMTLNGH
jgi:hypothetical protein